MAITDYKITEQQIAEKGVVAAPDMLTGTAQENKGVFDRLVRETVAPAFNSVLDALADENEQRNADEATRKTQENARVAAEELRAAAENGRVAAETARETAERQRADETAGIVAQATRQAAAAEAAKTATEDARDETIVHKNTAYRYALDAAISKNTAEASATEAGQQAGSASGFAARAEEALSKMGVHIGADTPANGAKLWLCPVNNPLVMNPDRASSDMTQEVGVNDDGKLVTAVEDGSVSESKLAQDVKDKFRSLSEEIITTAESKVSAHNTGTDTHSDIRLMIQGLTDRLNALADSDDTTLDQLSEIVAYIKSNRDLISAITTSKVNVADIVDNLTTNAANKPLSAAQGVALKALIDAITVPDKLPNPNALTFTGAVTGSYDGSAPLEVAIPSGGGGSAEAGYKDDVKLLDVTLDDTTGGLKCYVYDVSGIEKTDVIIINILFPESYAGTITIKNQSGKVLTNEFPNGAKGIVVGLKAMNGRYLHSAAYSSNTAARIDAPLSIFYGQINGLSGFARPKASDVITKIEFALSAVFPSGTTIRIYKW